MTGMGGQGTIGSFIAIGDSFTEGMGDAVDGTERGWADFVALRLAEASDEPVLYANLAIRGLKLGAIIDTQLEPALDQAPDMLTFNGGGNDIMRPRVSVDDVVERTLALVERVREAGTRPVIVAGANPSRHMPMGRIVRSRGDDLARTLGGTLSDEGVLFVDNWRDEVLEDARYWSIDRIHLGPLGHARVAANVLTALGVPVPPEWGVEEVAQAGPSGRSRNSLRYYRDYVLPWIGRRLTGRSSGDGRTAKRPLLLPVD